MPPKKSPIRAEPSKWSRWVYAAKQSLLKQVLEAADGNLKQAGMLMGTSANYVAQMCDELELRAFAAEVRIKARAARRYRTAETLTQNEDESNQCTEEEIGEAPPGDPLGTPPPVHEPSNVIPLAPGIAPVDYFENEADDETEDEDDSESDPESDPPRAG